MKLACDNIHGLSPAVAAALRELDPGPIRELAMRCKRAGAAYIDLNPGYLSPRHEDRMEFLVETVQDTVALPLILDSPSPRILKRGLAACGSVPILNAVWLDKQKLQEVLPLAVEHGTPLVLLLMDERSFSPPTVEEKIALALELHEIAVQTGLPHEDLIFDPILPNLSWDDALHRIGQDIETVRLLSSGIVFQESARTMAGLSNLLSGGSGKRMPQMDSTCMAMLAGAGLEILLANCLKPGLLSTYTAISSLIPTFMPEMRHNEA